MEKINLSKRTCFSCSQDIISNVESVLEWQTREFCSVNCLDTYISLEETLQICSCCKLCVSESSKIKFCTRFGTDIQQFCSLTCLENFKLLNSFCKLCHERIVSFMLISEEEKFCSPFCVSRYNGKGINQLYFVNENPCFICEKVDIHHFEMLRDVQSIFFCSKECIIQYKRREKLKMYVCSLCGCLLNSPSDHFYKEGVQYIFCSKQCGNVFILSESDIYSCAICQVNKYDFDLIKLLYKGSCLFYCSLDCLKKGDTEKPSKKDSLNTSQSHSDIQVLSSFKPNKRIESDIKTSSVSSYTSSMKNNILNKEVAKAFKSISSQVLVEKFDKAMNFSSSSVSSVSQSTQTKIAYVRDKKSQTNNRGMKVIPVPFPVYIPTPVSLPKFKAEPLWVPFALPFPIFSLDPARKKQHRKGKGQKQHEEDKTPSRNRKDEEDLTSKDERIRVQTTTKNVKNKGKKIIMSDWEKEFAFGTWGSSPSVSEDTSRSCSPAFADSGDDHSEPDTAASTSSAKKPSTNLIELEEQTITSDILRLNHLHGVMLWDTFVSRVRKDEIFMEKLSSRNESFKNLGNSDRCLYLTTFLNDLIKGRRYHPNTVIFILLCMQKHLASSSIVDSIFINVCFQKFKKIFYDFLQEYIDEFSSVYSFIESQKKTPRVRIREEMLWESFQLGSASPSVLLFTVFYINTKVFMLKSPAEHEAMAFKRFIKVFSTQALKDGTPFVTKVLRYSSGVKQKHRYREIFEDLKNPLRCSVKINEFYASKCPREALLSSSFYYSPILNCCPDSKIWFSSRKLPLSDLECMFKLALMVEEVQDVIMRNSLEAPCYDLDDE